MMKKYIIFIFLLLNSLSSFSVGNSLVGPTTVDPGTYYSYRANLDGWDINTVVRWKITNGRFNNVNGPTEPVSYTHLDVYKRQRIRPSVKYIFMHAKLTAVKGIANVIIPIRDDSFSMAAYGIFPNPNNSSAIKVRNRKITKEVHIVNRNKRKVTRKVT